MREMNEAESVAGKELEPEHIEPVRVTLAGQQLRRTLANALWTDAPDESAVIDKETKQLQVVVTDMTAQEEIIAQTAVEILDNRTCPRCVGHRFLDGTLDIVEPVPKLLAERGLALPIGRTSIVHALEFTYCMDKADGDTKPRGDLGEFLIENTDEGQNLTPLILEGGADGTNTVRAQRFSKLQFPDDKVEQFRTSRKIRSGKRKDVVMKPFCQGVYIPRKFDRLGFRRAGTRKLFGQRGTFLAFPGTLHLVFQLLPGGSTAGSAALEEENKSAEMSLSIWNTSP